MSYMTISSQEKHNFSLCSCFHAHPTTLLLKILGGTNAWAVPPPQVLGGTVPPVPPRSPPLLTRRNVVPTNCHKAQLSETKKSKGTRRRTVYQNNVYSYCTKFIRKKFKLNILRLKLPSTTNVTFFR